MHSDLCVPDGMPIVWLSRLLAIPIKERVSGSDLFDAIRRRKSLANPIRVFLFGGADGVSETVCDILNSSATGIRCVGWLNPGFGSFEDMSTENIIAKINGSKADLLAVFLSAKKAQDWLLHNHDVLTVPIRGQFGATINYQAGPVRRAPAAVQRLGFEWLWRIKEEPYLWRRYWNDGLSLARLAITHALPVALGLGWRRYINKKDENELSFEKREHNGVVDISLVGYATKMQVSKSIALFRDLLGRHSDIVVDISRTRSIDPRFFGLLLMFRKQLKENGSILKFTGVSKQGRQMFQRNGFDFLLESDYR
jgi:N-acetylglucosaminyldiphosphoundecaprenol N-acetyl-beta-D-mannosaminyltransferase